MTLGDGFGRWTGLGGKRLKPDDGVRTSQSPRPSLRLLTSFARPSPLRYRSGPPGERGGSNRSARNLVSWNWRRRLSQARRRQGYRPYWRQRRRDKTPPENTGQNSWEINGADGRDRRGQNYPVSSQVAGDGHHHRPHHLGADVGASSVHGHHHDHQPRRRGGRPRSGWEINRRFTVARVG